MNRTEKIWFHQGNNLLNSRKSNRVFLFMAVFMAELVLVSFLDSVVFASGCQQLYDGVLRLHILADSDSAEDQQIKINVRDKVLIKAHELKLGEGCSTMEELTRQAEKMLPQLREAAQQEVYRNHSQDRVTVQIADMYFNTRNYENFTMPAGKYRAVRFIIGSGQGKNWWCVLFPQLCLPAAFEEPEEEEEFSPSQLRVLKSRPHYEPRFAILELLYRLKEKF